MCLFVEQTSKKTNAEFKSRLIPKLTFINAQLIFKRVSSIQENLILNIDSLTKSDLFLYRQDGVTSIDVQSMEILSANKQLHVVGSRSETKFNTSLTKYDRLKKSENENKVFLRVFL